MRGRRTRERRGEKVGMGLIIILVSIGCIGVFTLVSIWMWLFGKARGKTENLERRKEW